MTPHELTALIAKLESKLTRQQFALKDTLNEIENIEAFRSPKAPVEEQKAIAATIAQLSVKRLRQHNAVLATEGYLKVLRTTKTATK